MRTRITSPAPPSSSVASPKRSVTEPVRTTQVRPMKSLFDGARRVSNTFASGRTAMAVSGSDKSGANTSTGSATSKPPPRSGSIRVTACMATTLISQEKVTTTLSTTVAGTERRCSAPISAAINPDAWLSPSGRSRWSLPPPLRCPSSAPLAAPSRLPFSAPSSAPFAAPSIPPSPSAPSSAPSDPSPMWMTPTITNVQYTSTTPSSTV